MSEQTGDTTLSSSFTGVAVGFGPTRLALVLSDETPSYALDQITDLTDVEAEIAVARLRAHADHIERQRAER